MGTLVGDVPVLVDLAGTMLQAFSINTSWELEDREDSTNRLTLTVALKESLAVTVDMEVIFRYLRFKVTSVSQDRGSDTATIICDEVQTELSELYITTYILVSDTLSTALTKALANTQWSAGTIYDNVSHNYSINLEKVTVAQVLRFLQTQSGQLLQFDSMSRKVSFVNPTPPPIDKVLTYGTGVEGFSREVTAPQVTVLYPTGRRGMTISSVNGGTPYLEDFSWYLGQGLTIQQARARFRRVQYWMDERYTTPISLKTAAEERLHGLSQPVTNYKMDVERGLSDQYKLGDRAWIVDEILGAKLDSRVVRIQRYGDSGQDVVEFSHLPKSDGFGDDLSGNVFTNDDNSPVYFQVKNTSPLTVTSTPAPILVFDVIVISATAFQVGLALRMELSQDAQVSGYYQIDGDRFDAEIQEDAKAGWRTFGMSWLAAGVEVGTRTLRFFLSVSAGTASIPERYAEMFVSTWGAIGGISNERPDQKVLEDVPLWFPDFHWSDPQDLEPTVDLMVPIGASPQEIIAQWMSFAYSDPEDDHRIETFFPSVVDNYEVVFWGMQPLQYFDVQVYDSNNFLVGGGNYQADANGEYVMDILVEFNLSPGAYTVKVLRNAQADTSVPQTPPADTMGTPSVEDYTVTFSGMNARQSFEVTIFDDTMTQVGQGTWLADSMGGKVIDFQAEFSLSVGLYYGQITGFTPADDFTFGESMSAPSVSGTEVTFQGMLPGQHFEVMLYDQIPSQVAQETFQADGSGELVIDLADHFSLASGTYDGVVTNWPVADFQIVVP